LRIEGGKIAERWSIDDLWPSGSLSGERELPVGAESYRQPSIQRFVLEPGSSFDLTVLGPVVLWVESGELALEMSGTDQAGVTRFPTEPLVPGSLRMVEPSSGKLRVRALGLEGVELWTAGLDAVSLPVAPAGMGYGNLPSGIEQDAGVALALQLRGQDVQLSVLVVTLPSGSVLSTSAASMHAAVVVSGALQAQPETGEIFYCFDGSRSRLLTGIETAHSGAGFANQRGGSAFYQVAGPDPATLVLVAIHPVVPSPAHLIRTGPG